MNCENMDLYLREENDLLSELNTLPSNNLINKINRLIQRCRQVKAHSLIMSYLKEQYSSQWFHKEDKKHELIEQLPHVFHTIYVNNSNEVSVGDFPDVQIYQKLLLDADWSQFHQIKNHHPELIEHVDDLLNNNLSSIIHEIQYNVTNKPLKLNITQLQQHPLPGKNDSQQSSQQQHPENEESQQQPQRQQQQQSPLLIQQPQPQHEIKQQSTINDPINHPEQIANRYHQKNNHNNNHQG